MPFGGTMVRILQRRVIVFRHDNKPHHRRPLTNAKQEPRQTASRRRDRHGLAARTGDRFRRNAERLRSFSRRHGLALSKLRKGPPDPSLMAISEGRALAAGSEWDQRETGRHIAEKPWR